jgi:UPF0716 protein FxsA
MGLFVLTFLVMAVLEIFILLRITDWIGFIPTLALVFGTAIVGGYLAKREGLRVWHSYQRALVEMRMPEEGMMSGLLVLVGALLLMTPGVLSDAMGFALLIPPVRRMVARHLEQWTRARMERGGTASIFDVRVVSPRGVYAKRRVVDVQGEVVEDREIRGPNVWVVETQRPLSRGGDIIEADVIDTNTRRIGG